MKANSYRKPFENPFSPAFLKANLAVVLGIILALMAFQPTHADAKNKSRLHRVFHWISTSRSRSSAAVSCRDVMEPQLESLIKVRRDPVRGLVITGLTQRGLDVLKHERDVLRQWNTLFNQELLDMNSLFHAGLVGRAAKQHMYLMGPPGGAKSAFVNWILNREHEKSFRIQMHQGLTEIPFVGGEDFEAAKRGVHVVNTKGSLVDYALGLIDEAEKGNPMAFAALLSLLNEREVLLGNRVVQARLETLFVTSNANLPEFLQLLEENGQKATGPALLNRFLIKGFMYNWLTPDLQAHLDERNEERRRLQALADAGYPEALNHELFAKPPTLDWPSLRILAGNLIRPGEEFRAVMRDFANEMRLETNRAIRQSEADHRTDPTTHPFVKFPSADYTERLRQQLPQIVIDSAFIDFLLSPMADDANLQALANGHDDIVLDPASMWRTYLVLTTVGPGEAKLALKQQEMEAPAPGSDAPAGAEELSPELKEALSAATRHLDVFVDFGWKFDMDGARDEREQSMVQELQNDQATFNRYMSKHLQGLKPHMLMRAQHPVPGFESDELIEDTAGSFEIRLLQANGR